MLWRPLPAPEKSSRLAARKAAADLLLRQVAADEHEPALALLPLLPRPLMVAVEDHVDALEHEALRIVPECQDALAAQNVRPFVGHEILHPREELVGIEGFAGSQRQGLHLFVVIMLQAAMLVAVLATLVAMIMIGMTLLFVEERRLEIEDSLEIERVASEHLVQRQPAALGPVQCRVRIDGTDARFDVTQLLRRDQVRLVDENHVRKRDLILRFRG